MSAPIQSMNAPVQSIMTPIQPMSAPIQSMSASIQSMGAPIYKSSMPYNIQQINCQNAPLPKRFKPNVNKPLQELRSNIPVHISKQSTVSTVHSTPSSFITDAPLKYTSNTTGKKIMHCDTTIKNGRRDIPSTITSSALKKNLEIQSKNSDKVYGSNIANTEENINSYEIVYLDENVAEDEDENEFYDEEDENKDFFEDEVKIKLMMKLNMNMNVKMKMKIFYYKKNV